MAQRYSWQGIIHHVMSAFKTYLRNHGSTVWPFNPRNVTYQNFVTLDLLADRLSVGESRLLYKRGCWLCRSISIRCNIVWWSSKTVDHLPGSMIPNSPDSQSFVPGLRPISSIWYCSDTKIWGKIYIRVSFFCFEAWCWIRDVCLVAFVLASHCLCFRYIHFQPSSIASSSRWMLEQNCFLTIAVITTLIHPLAPIRSDLTTGGTWSVCCFRIAWATRTGWAPKIFLDSIQLLNVSKGNLVWP